MMSYFAVVVIVILLIVSSALSAHYEYNLSFDAVIMYFLIAVTIAFLCAMIIAVIAACFVKLQQMLTPSTEPAELSPTEMALSPAQMAVISILQQLTQVNVNEPAKTLPTYNKALLLSKPVRLDVDLESNQSPPAYTTILMPPPYYPTNEIITLPEVNEGSSVNPGIPPPYSAKE
uniref:Transmembrane protein n=1 Tax=Panagrellus redivivus TaxID=6233 RepID=A0A7E4ZUV4_PANRE